LTYVTVSITVVEPGERRDKTLFYSDSTAPARNLVDVSSIVATHVCQEGDIAKAYICTGHLCRITMEVGKLNGNMLEQGGIHHMQLPCRDNASGMTPEKQPVADVVSSGSIMVCLDT
jgi:hypothetical protein